MQGNINVRRLGNINFDEVVRDIISISTYLGIDPDIPNTNLDKYNGICICGATEYYMIYNPVYYTETARETSNMTYKIEFDKVNNIQSLQVIAMCLGSAVNGLAFERLNKNNNNEENI